MAFHALVPNIPANRRKHNVTVKEMAAVASCVLDAEISYREGKYEPAFQLLRDGIKLFDALPYDEPEGWLISVRQTAGALLTEQKHYEEAATLYEEDLVKYPNTIWSLVGLKTCYHSLNPTDKRITDLERRIESAGDLADIKVGASCACALTRWHCSSDT